MRLSVSESGAAHQEAGTSSRSGRATLAAVAVIVLITLSIFAVGFSALEQGRDVSAANAATPAQEAGDVTAISAFKFVCPFH